METVVRRGIVKGYDAAGCAPTAAPCFKPYNEVTGGQLAQITVLAEGWQIDAAGGPHFPDVPVGHTFYDYAETAFNKAVISGKERNTRANRRDHLSLGAAGAREYPAEQAEK